MKLSASYLPLRMLLQNLNDFYNLKKKERKRSKIFLVSVMFNEENRSFQYVIIKPNLMNNITVRIFSILKFSSVQSLSRVRLFTTPWIAAHQASLSITIPVFTQTHIHQVGDAIQPSHPLSSPSLPDPNPSQHQSLFQWVNSSHEVAKVLEFQF